MTHSARVHAALLLLLCALLLLPGLGSRDLWAPNEPTHAQVAREMMRSGDWLVPRVAGEPYEGKPPLLHWLVAAASLPRGDVTEGAARLPSAVAAALGVLALWALARRFLAPDGALFAGVALAASLQWLWKGRYVEPDALMGALVAAALLAHVRALEGRPAWLLAEGAAVGLAMLAKGPVALLFTLLPLAVLHVWERRGLPAGWALGGAALAVGLPLLWLAGAAAGGYDVAGVLGTQVVERATGGLHHRRPLPYYLWTFPAEAFPLAGFLPGALVLAWRERKKRWVRLALSWLLPGLVVLSLVPEKRGVYLLPLYPAAALLAGGLFAAAGRGTGTGRRGLVLAVLLAGVPMVLLAPLVVYGGLGEYQAVRGTAWLLAAWMALVGLAAVAAVWRWPRRAAFAVLLGCGLLWAAAAWGAAGLDPQKSARAFGEAVRATRPAAPLGYYGHFRPATLFYSDRHGAVLETPSEAACFVADSGGALLVLDEEAVPELRSAGLEPRAILRQAPVGHRIMLLLEVAPSGPSPGTP